MLHFQETEVRGVSIGVQPLGQHPGKGHLKVNTDHSAPWVLPTDEGNFNSHAEDTLHMAICTSLPQVASLKKKERKQKIVQIFWPVQTCISNGGQLTSWSHILFHYLLFHILPSIHHLQTTFLSEEVSLTGQVLRF